MPELRVVGAGLIGTSVALAAAAAGWAVSIEDSDPRHQQVARDRLVPLRTPSAVDQVDQVDQVVCVAVPPALTARIVERELRLDPTATVIDVASIKADPQREVESLSGQSDRVVWTHPIAGAEGRGPSAGRADLFLGRTWVVVPGSARPEHARRVETVLRLIRDCGARPLLLDAGRHDDLLARTSHLPQLLASALALEVEVAFSGAAGDEPLHPAVLAGPGLLDMTRLAGSPGELWEQVAALNREPLRASLDSLLRRLTALSAQLAVPDGAGRAVRRLVDDGRSARAEIARKHDGEARPPGASEWAWVQTTIADVPGTLARVFAVAGELGVNVEDVQVDHAPYASRGVVSVAVSAADGPRLTEALRRDTHLSPKQ